MYVFFGNSGLKVVAKLHLRSSLKRDKDVRWTRPLGHGYRLARGTHGSMTRQFPKNEETDVTA